MKFVDEAIIDVAAGKGGNGCVSFLRARFMPRGGPNGGDGGDGGSVYLKGDSSMNTLSDFRNQRKFDAEHGRNGEGKNCSGRKGNDLIVSVPVGTVVHNHETGEIINDIDSDEQTLLVARGGLHGVGNTRFKSSRNRSPRQFTDGTQGEKHILKLELKLLADVGLVGLPNAGKSTFLSAVSSAQPKIADYPFTTLHPILGVVNLQDYRSFVVADIPGLIEGASKGTGLGIQFLRHLQRTSLLLHLIDINDCLAGDGVHCIHVIDRELEQFDQQLSGKARWLVFTKSDSVDLEKAEDICAAIVRDIAWENPWFIISSVAQKGLTKLKQAILQKIDNERAGT